MRTQSTIRKPSKRGVSVAVFGIALAATSAIAGPRAAHGDRVPPPEAPADIAAPAGHNAFRAARATGTQNYICLASGAGATWTFLGPQATLFDDDHDQAMTHFLSPNPDEGGTARATWQHSGDTSAVWARAVASSTDPAFVAPGAIPWLRLEVVGAEDGPTGGDTLTATTYIQRVNTAGGAAPSTGCASAADAGNKAFVPYTTDYIFYEADDDE
jgi:hypothetical protein